MSLRDLFSTLADRLQSSASVKTVYGDPVLVEGKTIIPVAKVAYGFGGGSGPRKNDGDSEGGEESGGAGGGVSASPVGVVEITHDGTRFVSFEERRKLAAALIIGLLLGIRLGRRRNRS